MIEVRMVLADKKERETFNKFWSMIETYREMKAQQTGGPMPVAEEAPPPAPVVTEDPAVIATITEEGVKYADKRAPRQVEMFEAPVVATPAEVETKFREFAAAHGVAPARDLLGAFDVRYFKDLPKEKYAEFVKRMAEAPVTA